MGFDLTTWVPMVGGGGADAYDIPAEDLWARGDSSRDLNQIIAVVNDRCSTFDAAFGTSLGTLSNIAAEDRISVAALSTIRTKINAVRVAEGFASYTFESLAANNRDWTRYIGELRRALRIAGVMTPTLASSSMYERYDDPYGSLVSESLISDAHAGKISGLTNMYRRRALYSFRIPPWVTASYAGTFTFFISSYLNSLDPFYGVELWASASDDHAYASAAAGTHTDYASGSEAVATGWHVLPVYGATLSARAGSYLSLILGVDLEFSGGGDSEEVGMQSTFPHASEVFAVDFGT